MTPRLPQGFSVFSAAGQWQNADGKIIKENSHVLQIIHPQDAITEQSLVDIITLYKKQFQQETVLRSQSYSCSSFL